MELVSTITLSGSLASAMRRSSSTRVALPRSASSIGSSDTMDNRTRLCRLSLPGAPNSQIGSG